MANKNKPETIAPNISVAILSERLAEFAIFTAAIEILCIGVKSISDILKLGRQDNWQYKHFYVDPGFRQEKKPCPMDS